MNIFSAVLSYANDGIFMKCRYQCVSGKMGFCTREYPYLSACLVNGLKKKLLPSWNCHLPDPIESWRVQALDHFLLISGLTAVRRCSWQLQKNTRSLTGTTNYSLITPSICGWGIVHRSYIACSVYPSLLDLRPTSESQSWLPSSESQSCNFINTSELWKLRLLLKYKKTVRNGLKSNDVLRC